MNGSMPTASIGLAKRGSVSGKRRRGAAVRQCGEAAQGRRNSDLAVGAVRCIAQGAQLCGGGVGAAMEKRFDVWGSLCLCVTGQPGKA